MPWRSSAIPRPQSLAFVSVWLSLEVHLVLALWNALSERAWARNAASN
jgi:hypothetical protein